MMRNSWPFWLIAAAWLAAPASAGPGMMGAGGSLARNDVDSGGQLSSNAGATIDAGIGETLISSASGAGLQFFPGLMNFIAQPGSVTSLVAVSKDTGTLELSWTSPGLDGSLGGVLSGYWRIDSSSDPAHVFSPETFLVELATVTAPGSSQYYTFAGLLPDTTYFTRIYLADSRKMVAETSAPSDESTLAKLPNFPQLTGVFITSVTFTWSVPATGAQGYDIDGSTTNFGILSPGGSIVSSTTFNGAAVTLTVTGLNPASTYYFKLGSLNWQDQGNYNSVIATVTFPGGVLPIYNLAVSSNALGRSVVLTWSNPLFANPGGVLVVVSTKPISSTPANGTAYPIGTLFADGSVVGSSAAASAFDQGGLSLDTTEYYSLYEQDTGHTYSVAVSTQVTIDLPPMAPAGLWADWSAALSTITIHWSQVSSNLDGSSFKSPFSPVPWELDHYSVYRSTGIVRPNWVFIGSTTASSLSYAAAVPLPNFTYYYKVVSLDAYPITNADAAMIVDNYGNVYALDQDQVTRLDIPASLAGILRPTGNSYGAPLLIRTLDLGGNPSQNVVNAVAFDAFQSPTNAPVSKLTLPSAGASVTMAYGIANSQYMPASVTDPSHQLGLFYYNGDNYVKLFGAVDSLGQTVSVQTAQAGTYQIKSFNRAEGFSFDVSQMTNKFITPNGDGLNDNVTFVFDNPNLSAFSGSIYDMTGAFVATMQPNPKVGSFNLMWDGKASGRTVSRGVYIYKISAEGKTFTGTVVVVR